MGSGTASRGSILGLAGLCSLCCVGSGTVAVAGGGVAAGGTATGWAAGGLGAGFAGLVVAVLSLTVAGLAVRHRRSCPGCDG